MNKITLMLGATVVLLAGCEEFEGMASPGSGLIANVPEEVLALAGPGQPTDALRKNPVDGCYEYQHVGPVETTFLPLRTAKGNPICTAAAS